MPTIEDQRKARAVLAGFQKVLILASEGNSDEALDTLDDLLDQDNFEDTLDGAEVLSKLVVKASDDEEESEDEDYDDEDESEDEDYDDEDEDGDEEEEVTASTRQRNSLNRKSTYLQLAFAPLDEIEDEMASDDEDEDEDYDDEEEDEDEEEVVESSTRRGARRLRPKTQEVKASLRNGKGGLL